MHLSLRLQSSNFCSIQICPSLQICGTLITQSVTGISKFEIFSLLYLSNLKIA
jgi:hypothetical protein